MNNLTLYNDLKDKDNNIPQILLNAKNVIEGQNFKKDLEKIQPLIKNLKINDILKIQNGGKNTKNTKNTKKNLKKNSKTKKNKIYKGGYVNNGLKYIIMIIIIAALFTIPSQSVYELFDSFIQYPKSFFEYIIVPFSNVLYSTFPSVKTSIGYNVVETGVSTVVMPTLYGFYKTCVSSLTGNVLAVNGLWGLYLNSTKLLNYIDVNFSNVNNPDVKMQTALENVNNSLNNVVKEISQPQQLNLQNISENVDSSNVKTIDIPEGSKLLIPKNSHI
jgi:hypothetical protein